MSTYVEIVLPWKHGPAGYGVAADNVCSEQAIELALALVDPKATAEALEQPPIARFSFSLNRDYGTSDASAVRLGLDGSLHKPTVVVADVLPRIWVVAGCTITTHHPLNEHPGDDLYVSVQMPAEGQEVIAQLVNAQESTDSVEPVQDGWDLKLGALTVRVRPVSDDYYDDLYALDPDLDEYAWVASISRETYGYGNAVYASSPRLRPDFGGFMEFFGRVLRGGTSAKSLARAVKARRFRAVWSWLVTRTSTFTGWVSLPEEYADASQPDLLEYLHSPKSLDAGWIETRERLFPDRDAKNVPTLLDDPDIEAVVTESFYAKTEGLTVTVYHVRGRAEGAGTWRWLRLTRGKARDD